MISNGSCVSLHSTWYLACLADRSQLDNMRFALDTCLFGFRNNTDAVSTPCSTSNSCGPLQGAIEHANLDPDENPYTFCNADGNSMMGGAPQKCEQCLQSGGTEVYLSNCKLHVPSLTRGKNTNKFCNSPTGVERRLYRTPQSRHYARS